MGLVAKAGGGEDFAPVASGMQRAVCVGIYDLGTHKGEYQGVPNERHQVLLSWELPDEEPVTFEGKTEARCISAFYTLSLGEKATLFKHLQSWRGRPFTADELNGFELRNVLGAPCMLNIIHKKNSEGKLKAKVDGVTGLVKGMSKPVATLPLVYYSIEDHGKALPSGTPTFVADIVAKSMEWANDLSIPASAIPAGSVAGDVQKEDIPF